MAKRKIKLLDTVALLEDLPERKLKRGDQLITLHNQGEALKIVA